ncbi:MAG: hypothetical protein KC503_21230, partial [Myxococcales bacterium]|nr:hypothetical protein [Myxococcales bacterium]
MLEPIGPDGEAQRYLVYDMNSLKRVHLRIVADEGSEEPKRIEVVDESKPLEPAPGAAASAQEAPAASAPSPLPPGSATAAAPSGEKKPALRSVTPLPPRASLADNAQTARSTSPGFDASKPEPRREPSRPERAVLPP